MSAEDVKDLDQFNAPFNKEVRIQEYVFENGFPMLRLRIREGTRFTTMDLDPITAKRWGALMADWADAQDLEGQT